MPRGKCESFGTDTGTMTMQFAVCIAECGKLAIQFILSFFLAFSASSCRTCQSAVPSLTSKIFPQARQVYSRQTSPVKVFLSVWNNSPPHLGQESWGLVITTSNKSKLNRDAEKGKRIWSYCREDNFFKHSRASIINCSRSVAS